MSNITKHFPPDDLPPDVERQWTEWQEEERANRSPADWWEEDHLDQLDDSDAEELTAALDGLVGAGCSRAELLGCLRDIESCVGRNSLVPKRKLDGFVTTFRTLANKIERLASSLDFYYVPDADRVAKGLRELAKGWESAYTSENAEVSKLVKRLARFVDSKVRERGRLGKGRADKAVALLVAEVTDSKRTYHAIRVARSRMKPKGPKVLRDKVKPARRLPGSRTTGRKRKWVSLEVGEGELARKGRHG